jgi:mannosylglycoprotein endo-beta-mannosidase
LYIGECTRLVCVLIDRCEDEEIPGLLILLDFEKAFDSLEWSFISKSLEFFGFRESIIYWFQTLYNNVESCVQNNSHLSERFVVRRGVRQNDPLSPYLFIIAVELLVLQRLKVSVLITRNFLSASMLMTQHCL